MVCWSTAASSLTPQRRSIAWNRAPCEAQKSRSSGHTRLRSSSRSAAKSSNVELTNTRKVRARPAARAGGSAPTARSAAFVAGVSLPPLSLIGSTGRTGSGEPVARSAPAVRSTADKSPGATSARPAAAAWADASAASRSGCHASPGSPPSIRCRARVATAVASTSTSAACHRVGIPVEERHEQLVQSRCAGDDRLEQLLGREAERQFRRHGSCGFLFDLSGSLFSRLLLSTGAPVETAASTTAATSEVPATSRPAAAARRAACSATSARVSGGVSSGSLRAADSNASRSAPVTSDSASARSCSTSATNQPAGAASSWTRRSSAPSSCSAPKLSDADASDTPHLRSRDRIVGTSSHSRRRTG